jgi:hypothetical protein
MTFCNGFRCKKPFFHYYPPLDVYLYKNKKNSSKEEVNFIRASSFGYTAGISTVFIPAAGFHRARPSTTLDKVFI